MTLVSIREELAKARAEHYAVPLFDVFDMHSIEGVMDALIEHSAPTIMGIYASFAEQPSCAALTAYLRRRAEDTDVPLSIMLDHGASVEQCLRVLSYGFTDVMYDGSKLPLAENIANTRRVVEAAHRLGAGVEAELGHVGVGSEYDQFGARRIGFTDPDVVEYFVRETGVDYLAVAFGNAHGFYKGEPNFDLDLLAEIRARVSVPLVMHGGTGTTDEQFRAVIAAGISKVNFATSIIHGAGEKMKTAAAAPDASMFSMTAAVHAAFREWSAHLYEVFGTSQRAGLPV